jgi:hypothetical protein
MKARYFVNVPNIVLRDIQNDISLGAQISFGLYTWE